MVNSPQDLGREFTAEVYRAAAAERMGCLQLLYDNRQYTLATYVAGVAVESIFRAYRCKIDPEFDSRHDLHGLAYASRFAAVVPKDKVREFPVWLEAVASRWSNSHRYRSDAALKAYLKRKKLDRGIRGDYLKENARRAIAEATKIVSLGVTKWKP